MDLLGKYLGREGVQGELTPVFFFSLPKDGVASTAPALELLEGAGLVRSRVGAMFALGSRKGAAISARFCRVSACGGLEGARSPPER